MNDIATEAKRIRERREQRRRERNTITPLRAEKAA